MIYTKMWLDGIGFYTREEINPKYEIAFYSNHEKTIRYRMNDTMIDFGINIEDNQFILNKVKEYINRKDKVVTKDGLYFTAPTN